ncbi:hypothetical protein VMCG_03977 [Cytospora schulzeri]|uniref:Adhesin domain-containing protein n=1 Tax=Cytospora schulzeri TaxID=448051 RepID=A0A423WTV7_9PEZI|nr:hypothetical protein VMCG_03977 [Valsa malicola]
MYSGLEDSDIEEQPLEYPYQAGSGPADGDRQTPGHGHGYGPGNGLATVGDDHVDDDDDDEYHHDQHHDEQVLSPTDGYFGRSGSGPSATTSSAYPGDPYSSSSQGNQEARVHAAAAAASASPSTTGYAAAASSQVPHVPDVWVSDPTIDQRSTAESKAREAREERESNSRSRGGQLDTPLSHHPPASHTVGGGVGSGGGPPASSYPSSQSSSTSASGYPRYGYGPGLSSAGPYTQRYTPPSSSTAALSRPQRSGTIYSERSSLFSEAPPAYTPSPTSPTSVSSNNNNNINNNYQPFSPSANMGRISESETQALLAGNHHHQYRSLQDMGGDRTGGDYNNNNNNSSNNNTGSRVGEWRDRARSCVSQFTGRRTCKSILLGLLLLFVAVGFLVSSFVSMKDEEKTHKPGGGHSGHGGPGSSPIGKMPVQDGHGTRLAYPPFDGEMAWAEGRLCADNQINYPTQTFNLDFSAAHSLSFIQNIKENHAHNGQDVHVSGDVVVRRAGKGTPGPSITLEVISNDEQIRLDINWDQNEQELHIRTPPSIPWPRNGVTSPCLQIRATIWTPPGSVLNNLNIEAVHLGVQLLDNLSLELTNLFQVSSTVGAVVAATDGEKDAKQLMHGGAPATFTLESRHIEIRTVSSPIAGTWPLHDYLGLQTVSGTVRAGVQPREALREKPRPAVLLVHTTSGAIEVYEPVAEAAREAAASMAMQITRAVGAGLAARLRDLIPPREYVVDLYTMSGTVRGSLAFGSSCKVHTTSGIIDLTLLPVLDRSQAPLVSGGGGGGAPSYVLETATTSGTTVVNVLDALWRHVQTGSYEEPPSPRHQQLQEETTSSHSYSSSSSAPAIRVLDSRHATTSAAIRVTYPSTWEGDIEADTMSGGLDVSGRGVEIIRREEEFPGYKKHILARKGQEDVGGSLKCHSMSGSIKVGIGS